jgi:CTP:molybdopterin cytidylyltransferase MocA
MGSPKAALTLGDSTFLERAVQALRDGGCDPIYVIVDETDVVVMGEAERTGATVVKNPDPGEGPITSLRLAIGAVPPDADGIAYLPLDYPLVEAGTVSRLIDEAIESDAPLTLPVHGTKRGHPALFRRRLFDELVDPALEGGARVVVHRYLDQARIVDWPDATVITDVDTPADYEQLRSDGDAPVLS